MEVPTEARNYRRSPSVFVSLTPVRTYHSHRTHPGIDARQKHSLQEQTKQRTSNHAEDAEGDLKNGLAHQTAQVGQAYGHQAEHYSCTQKLMSRQMCVDSKGYSCPTDFISTYTTPNSLVTETELQRVFPLSWLGFLLFFAWLLLPQKEKKKEKKK